MSQEMISILELFQLFPDDKAAEEWFINERWPDGVCCAFCESENIKDSKAHKEMRFRCNDCKKWFSVKSNSLMHSSKLGLQKWAIAFYLMASHPKGMSSIQLSKQLGVTQKTAWHLEHRIRAAYDIIDEPFDGEVEIDEAFIGGLEKNKHSNKRLRQGGGVAGKQIVIGMKERDTNRVKAEVIYDRERDTMHKYITDNTTPDAIVYSDEFNTYRHMPRRHGIVNHNSGEYVDSKRPEIHTQGIESFWSGLKRSYKGMHHYWSPKHLQRYIDEHVGRFNNRDLTHKEHIADLARNTAGKRLRYKDLVAG